MLAVDNPGRPISIRQVKLPKDDRFAIVLDDLVKPYGTSEVNDEVVGKITAIPDEFTNVSQARAAHQALVSRRTFGVVQRPMVDERYF